RAVVPEHGVKRVVLLVDDHHMLDRRTGAQGRLLQERSDERRCGGSRSERPDEPPVPMLSFHLGHLQWSGGHPKPMEATLSWKGTRSIRGIPTVRGSSGAGDK